MFIHWVVFCPCIWDRTTINAGKQYAHIRSYTEQNIMEDVGTVVKGLTKYLNTMYAYKCVKMPAFVYEFYQRKKDQVHNAVAAHSWEKQKA